MDHILCAGRMSGPFGLEGCPDQNDLGPGLSGFRGRGDRAGVAEAAFLRSGEPLLSAALGVVPAALMFAVSKWTKGALGEGDAILFGVSGIFLGLTGNILFIWTTCLFTLAAGGICIALGKMTKKSTLPMGPFALAAWAALGAGGFLL